MSAFTVHKSYINSDEVNGFPVYLFKNLEYYLNLKEHHSLTTISYKKFKSG